MTEFNRRKYLVSASTVVTATLCGCLTDDTSTPGAETNTQNPSRNSSRTATETTQGQSTTQRNGTESDIPMGVLATGVNCQSRIISNFESLVVTINKIEIRPPDAGAAEEFAPILQTETPKSTSTQGDEGTEIVTPDEPVTTPLGAGDVLNGRDSVSVNSETGVIQIRTGGVPVDLVKLQGDAKAIISTAELPVEEFEWLRLHVDEDIDAVLTDGRAATIETPGGSPLNFTVEFGTRDNTRTTFVAGISPRRIGDGEYRLLPVSDDGTVSYALLNTSTPTPDSDS